MNVQTGIVNIRGKEYQTVALRVQLFREAHPDFSLTTEVVERAEDVVVMRAVIANAEGFVIATGHAEEYRKASQINKTSALENAETSAIGRALAAFGMGGTEFASANEVSNAIHQQNAPVDEPKAKAPAHSKLKSEVRALVHDIRGVGDWDSWVCLRETDDFKRIVADCQEKLPEWWEGWEEQPDGFTPLSTLIATTHEEMSRDATASLQAG